MRRKNGNDQTSNDEIGNYCVCISAINVGDHVYKDGDVYRWAEQGPSEHPLHFVALLSTTAERNAARTRTMESPTDLAAEVGAAFSS